MMKRRTLIQSVLAAVAGLAGFERAKPVRFAMNVRSIEDTVTGSLSATIGLGADAAAGTGQSRRKKRIVFIDKHGNRSKEMCIDGPEYTRYVDGEKQGDV